jgi:8-oxo-dGTP pyrophosphatase MutT (NUDIX family)
MEISSALGSHPARIIKPGSRAHAAVALILAERTDGLNILFIERAANENDFWSGQIALPGGRTERSDSSPRQTAERETLEEIGLDLSTARYLGRISDIAPGSLQIVVSCFVYAVRELPVLHPDAREIADAFWVPLRELNNPARRLYVEIPVRGVLRRFPAVKLTDDNKRPLWGLTYRLVRNLNKVIAPGLSRAPS